MGRLIVFNSVSLDGFFVDAAGGTGWAHNPVRDAEWEAFVAGNASGDGVLVFGRVTYEMMASYWTTPAAARDVPEVARGMNAARKGVFSRTLREAGWANARVLAGELPAEIRRMKKEPAGLAVLGSGSIVCQLAGEGLVDEFQVVMVPVVLGKGRTMFEGLGGPLRLRLASCREFRNGNVLLCYRPAAW